MEVLLWPDLHYSLWAKKPIQWICPICGPYYIVCGMDRTCIDKVYVVIDILFVVFIITSMHPYSPSFVHMINYYSSMCSIAFTYSFTFIHIHPYPITIIHISIFIHVFDYVYLLSFNDFHPHSSIFNHAHPHPLCASTISSTSNYIHLRSSTSTLLGYQL
jgi:hypothetical protein